jgi:hypothetical protein
MVSKELLDELRVILKEDYQLEVDQPGLFEIANSLVSFFDLLATMNGEINNL